MIAETFDTHSRVTATLQNASIFIQTFVGIAEWQKLSALLMNGKIASGDVNCVSLVDSTTPPSAAKLVGQSHTYWTVQIPSSIIRVFCRVLDYGVRSNLVIDRRRIEQLHVQLTDVYKWNDDLLKNLYCFRCWAGSAAFGDRFRQQFPESPHA